MNERLMIASELVELAREFLASDYVHRKDYTDADEEERYANELAETVYDHFSNGRLESPVVDYTIKVSPKRYLKRDAKTDAQKKSYDVRVVLIYKNLADESDIDCELARQTYRTHEAGNGEAHMDKDNLTVVALGSTECDWCDIDYFKDTIAHELMHILDVCAYEYFFTKDSTFGKRTKHEMKRGLCVKYPIGDVDCLDEQYAEYFTCEAEMREYRNDLRKAIQKWCVITDTEWKDAIDIIKESLSSDKSFRKFYNGFTGDISPLATLYHLCFSKTSHGNRQTAMRLLDGLQPLE